MMGERRFRKEALFQKPWFRRIAGFGDIWTRPSRHIASTNVEVLRGHPSLACRVPQDAGEVEELPYQRC